MDPNRIERVLVNLVQNALKYSPHDSPIVVRVGARGRTAVVSVVDRGPGLTAEEVSYVFDKYRRTPTAEQRDGLGLGLYISRKIVEAHRGRIGVDPGPGPGSTFHFDLPLDLHEQEALPRTITLEPKLEDRCADRLRGLRVLLVDDERNAVSALVSLLGEEGLDVSGATSGEQALAIAKASAPDVAVIDVEMPGMSGLSLLTRLRERQPDLPAVIMSGYTAHHPAIAQAREANGAAYVGKPVDIDELIHTLGRLFAARPPNLEIR
jgi:CheY-like chemotaxis protein